MTTRRMTFKETVEYNHPGLLDLLGTMTDREVGERYNLSRQRIHQIRLKLNVRPYTVPIELTSEQIAKLGTKTDADLASLWGVAASTVSRIRTSLSIEAYSPWLNYNKLLEPYASIIGKLSDPKIAELAGVTTRVVFEYRKLNNIDTEVITPTHKDFSPVDRNTLAQLFELGLSDEEIASVLGSTKGTVQNIRTSELNLLRR